MIIEEMKYKVRDIVKGYCDNNEDGVVAFSGALDVRPQYQREFIYPEDKQQKVIETILKEYPLNVFYWGTTGIAGRYELIDGQQRTISICRFIHGDYTIEYKGQEVQFQSLPQDIQDIILNYELTIYKCDGGDSEKLAWFETINIASEPLTTQELRNAVYTGTWLSDAKRYFSKSSCPAVQQAEAYLRGNPNRQEILEEVLSWAANKDNMKITEYMDVHRNDADAYELWKYFTEVIDWVKRNFGNEFKNMQSVKWGILYNRYHIDHDVDVNGNIKCSIYGETGMYSRQEFLNEIQRLYDDEEVTSRQGIYEYVLSGDERKLSIRKFSDRIKEKKYRQQNGVCALCGKPFELKDMHADHITPWSRGGKTIEANCQLLCVECNSKKSDRSEISKDEVPCSNCGKPVKKGMFCQFCGTKN